MVETRAGSQDSTKVPRLLKEPELIWWKSANSEDKGVKRVVERDALRALSYLCTCMSVYV